MNKRYLYSLLLVLITSMLSAQVAQIPSGDLITDRPDATEAPTVVPKGSLQVETGAFTTSFEENNRKETVLGYNTTLLRYGILDNLELRIGWNYEDIKTEQNGQEIANATGFSPLLFGAKVAIAQENGWKPEIGLIGHLFLPFTAGSDFKPEFTSADFRFAFNHTLSEKSGIAYNIGGQYGGDSPELAYIYTFAYGYAISEN